MRVCPTLAPAECQALMSSATVLVNSSRSESMSSAILEAMALGECQPPRPLLLSRCLASCLNLVSNVYFLSFCSSLLLVCLPCAWLHFFLHSFSSASRSSLITVSATRRILLGALLLALTYCFRTLSFFFLACFACFLCVFSFFCVSFFIYSL